MSPELLLSATNTLISGGILLYVVRNEHRFTKLETAMQIVMEVLKLKIGGRRSSDVG